MSERNQLWFIFAICLLATSTLTVIGLDRWRSVEWAEACETCLKEWSDNEKLCRTLCRRRPEEGP